VSVAGAPQQLRGWQEPGSGFGSTHVATAGLVCIGVYKMPVMQVRFVTEARLNSIVLASNKGWN
jgi:hypothetical protein